MYCTIPSAKHQITITFIFTSIPNPHPHLAYLAFWLSLSLSLVSLSKSRVSYNTNLGIRTPKTMGTKNKGLSSTLRYPTYLLLTTNRNYIVVGTYPGLQPPLTRYNGPVATGTTAEAQNQRDPNAAGPRTEIPACCIPRPRIRPSTF